MLQIGRDGTRVIAEFVISRGILRVSRICAYGRGYLLADVWSPGKVAQQCLCDQTIDLICHVGNLVVDSEELLKIVLLA